MKIGVVYPQTEYGSDPAAIRDYAQTAEDLGFTHVLAYDHVLGANPDRPGGWNGPYTYQTVFQEPFLLFSYMAAVTRNLGFITGILILPQRQTALVAKQAATLDVLCGGRLRIGVGNGWNEVEYTSLGEDFHTRGKRMEEQVTLLRQLWTQPLVTFKGKWHDIPDAGIDPLPIQKPIPIWFGGHSEPVLKRTAQMGDGWLPNFRSPADALPVIDKINQYLQEAGRDRSSIGMEARLPYGDGTPDNWKALMDGWEKAGCDYISLNTMGSGLKTATEHITALRTFAEAVI